MSELWIKAMNGHVELFYSQPPKGTGNYIHVIEKSDYDEIQVRLKEVVSFKISEHEVQYNILKENYDELESKYRDLEKECSGWEDRASKPVEWCCKLRDENIEKLAEENLALQAKLDKAENIIKGLSNIIDDEVKKHWLVEDTLDYIPRNFILDLAKRAREYSANNPEVKS